jgi:hypothetical protein
MYVDVYVPGAGLLCRVNPATGAIEIQRRGVKHVIRIDHARQVIEVRSEGACAARLIDCLPAVVTNTANCDTLIVSG